jgi:membrane protein
VSGLATLLTNTWTEFSDDDCTSMAAAIAYYTIFSLAPSLVLVVMLVSLFWDPHQVQGKVQQQLADLFGQQGAQQVHAMMNNATQNRSGWTAVLGFIALALGATGLFSQLQAALNRTWEVAPDPRRSGIKGYVAKRLLSFAMILLIALLLFASLLLSAALSAFSGQLAAWLPGAISGPLLRWTDFGFSFVVTTVLFATVFKWLPDAKVPWSSVLVGAVVTSLLFVLGKMLIGVYLGHVNLGSAYGAAGSLVLVLVWVYYSAMILLLGAEFTQVWAQRRGQQVEPSEGAIRVVRQKGQASQAA